MTRMIKLVSDFLKKDGYNVFIAENGRQALGIFNERHIDLVILDVMMPEYDGWAVCREIRQVLAGTCYHADSPHQVLRRDRAGAFHRPGYSRD